MLARSPRHRSAIRRGAEITGFPPPTPRSATNLIVAEIHPGDLLLAPPLVLSRARGPSTVDRGLAPGRVFIFGRLRALFLILGNRARWYASPFACRYHVFGGEVAGRRCRGRACWCAAWRGAVTWDFSGADQRRGGAVGIGSLVCVGWLWRTDGAALAAPSGGSLRAAPRAPALAPLAPVDPGSGSRRPGPLCPRSAPAPLALRP